MAIFVMAGWAAWAASGATLRRKLNDHRLKVGGLDDD